MSNLSRGRPRTLDHEAIGEAIRRGTYYADIAREFGCCVNSVVNIARKIGETRGKGKRRKQEDVPI